MDYKAEVRELTQKALNNWFRRWEREHVEGIEKQLDNAAQDILAVCLGMSGRWAKWEVDSSRAKDSLVGQYIARHTNAAVALWLEKLFSSDLPGPSAKDREAARDRYALVFKDHVYNAMYQKATEDARKFVAELSDSVVSGITLEPPETVALADSVTRLGKPGA